MRRSALPAVECSDVTKSNGRLRRMGKYIADIIVCLTEESSMGHTIWRNIGNNNDKVKRGNAMNVIVRKDLVGVEMKCPSCGGHFFPTERWVYKNNKGDLVCNYHCTKVHKTKKLTGKQSMYSIAVRMADIGSKEKIAEAVMRAGFPSIVSWMESKVKELYEQTGLV